MYQTDDNLQNGSNRPPYSTANAFRRTVLFCPLLQQAGIPTIAPIPHNWSIISTNFNPILNTRNPHSIVSSCVFEGSIQLNIVFLCQHLQ
jgi:hypothetical protein